MKIFSLLFAGALISLVVPGATAQSVKAKTYEKVPEGMTTYHWRSGRTLTKTGLADNPTVDAMIHKAVEQQMSLRGFTESQGKDGLEISYMGGVTEKLQIDDPNLGNYAMLDIGGSFGYEGYTYKKSGLMLTVVDTATGKAVWTALATDNFGQMSQLQQRIDNAVTKSFEKFPIKKK